ncbi:MAG: low molecular weight phosphotyrosine protein phosphatase [Anaerolineae bacterium]|nr:low molecular weight phosphotyrosine protein phosphatase [Anaerolineae bacterium]
MKQPNDTRVAVLFVCAGNICRSPMAEGIFRHLVDEAGLSERIQIDSAGTGPWHVGEPPHRGTLSVLRKHGIAYDGRARRIVQSDFDDYDYVLVADRENLSYVRRLLDDRQQAHVGLLLGYAYHIGQVRTDEVPDPYYVGNFEEVYDLVRAGCEVLLAHIRAEHKL